MTKPNIQWNDLLTKKIVICFFTGFTSGLPLFILISLFPAWLAESGLDLKAIGLFALIQLPYAWKFIWAPLFDRFTLAMGRRRGWLIIFQIILLFLISICGLIDPRSQIILIAIVSIGIAFFSASQDIVIDAYRRELLLDPELGLGNAVHVNAYKFASLVPGSLSLILADFFSWEFVFTVTGLFMIPGIILTILISEPKLKSAPPKTMKEAVVDPFKEFLGRKGTKNALLILLFIFLYKIGDSMATALATPFYLGLGFSMTEIGIIAKNAGLWTSIAGGIIGGIWMVKLGINRALWIFGFLQMFATLSFAWLATVGYDNTVLAITVGLEFFAAGLGTTAFVAFIAKTTNPKYTATQFALFSSLASVPRTFTNASTGYFVDFFGWYYFFIFCFILAIPGMFLLLKIAPWRR
ncbi:AmpG family muropeptide MFS transporter [Nitrosomonadales bacterium]|nr:AmpG family muropeptide MFS transporter [Methylophilaceae bacterium]MDA9600366.1 AmpG family muropeptide MFS transporter [Nitrosomonadales bacterium]